MNMNQRDSNGQRDGYWEVNHNFGIIKANYHHGMRHGKWEYLPNKTNLGCDGFYVNNKQSGIWKWYNEDSVAFRLEYYL